MRGSLLIKNCLLYNETEKGRLTDILIEDGVIRSVSSGSPLQDAQEVIDAEGRVAAPGLIDIHIQGAGGADVLDNSLDSLKTIAATLARTGTTAYLGTTVVKPLNDNQHLRLAREYAGKDLGGAELLGFHLEGPFINPKKKGGLDPASIYDSSDEKVAEIFDVLGNTLKMMTIAPEMPGNLGVIKELTKHNVIAAFAHSDATYEEAIKGFEAGINHVTHIFNAMPPLTHRNPGPLTAIFESKNLSAQIISDGHHLHPAIVNLIYSILGPERSICITDGMHGIGLPDGMYMYNGREYESKAGAARYLDGTLIGSTMSLFNITQKFMEFTGCSLETAINSASRNPAKLLGIYDKKGSIDKGKDADIILIDGDNTIFSTIVKGKAAFSKN